MRPLFLLSFVSRSCAVERASLSWNIPRSTRPPSIRMASTLPASTIFRAIAKHDPASLAIVHSGSDRSFCYGSLLHDIAAAKDNLTAIAKGSSLQGERIAFLAENGYDYVGTTPLGR